MQTEMLQPLSGFRDNTSPAKDWVIEHVRQTFQAFNYQPLETPSLERQEILLGKLGEEGEKQLYLFEDNGKRPVGLRYDLTVPLSRFVAANLGSLNLPYKRYEIGLAWRAEKPQKGRYRQFTQADVDIVGAPEPASEFELLSIIKSATNRLGIEVTCRINDRQLVAELMSHLKVAPDVETGLLRLLDKKDKITEAEFDKKLQSLSLSDSQRRQVSRIFSSSGKEALKEIEGDVETSTGERLKEVLAEATRLGLKAEFTPAMVRGLDYYTGFIIECVVDGFEGGTVIAGGRYDSLVENLTGSKIPAVGVSFGIDRLADLVASRSEDSSLFVVRLPETSDEVDDWADEMRQAGRRVEVYLDQSAELGKQIKYADKRGYEKILIPLLEEWKKGMVAEKNLETGKQVTIKRSEVK